MIENDFGIELSSDADQTVHLIASDWQHANLSEVNSALCAYAEKLTQSPKEMNDADISSLRDLGLSDKAIHDATQVVSYFNYINRIADSLDVDLEPDVHPWELKPPAE